MRGWTGRAACAASLTAAIFAAGATAATAREKAAPAEAPKVLVVTSTTDELAAAGIAAINAASADGSFTVTAPTPAAVGAQFTAENLDQYRSIVFLNTGQASPLSGAQRTAFEGYFKKGGGLVGVGSAVETDASWSFLSDALGTRSSGRTALQSGTVKVFDRVHDASKNLPEYWERTENWYNFAADVSGKSHVLASVVEDPFGPQPGGHTLDGIAGGTMGHSHPVSFCKDFQGGRSFYTALGTSPAAFDASLREHLKGAIKWATGLSSPEYSDCGATVTKNYQQVRIADQPNVGEPIGFDQLPDGRILQTQRTGALRLHDPKTGTTQIIADFAAASVPLTQRIYTAGEDGLYGPAVDANFATNKWVYLYYSPQAVTDVKLSDGTIRQGPFTTPTTGAPATAASKSAWDPWVGYFQLSRFKFIDGDGTQPPRLDLASEEQIMRVTNNRAECCHVGGDIDFDKHGNLWLVTGDDTPAGGVNAGGYGPFNDQKTDETQSVRVNNATGGTFRLGFNGQTTAALPYDATAAQIDAALEALSTVGANNVQAVLGPVNTATVNVNFRRALQQSNQNALTVDGSGLTGASPTAVVATTTEGGLFQRLTGDARRTALNTNDLRGKMLRIKVKDSIPAAGANQADFTGNGSGAYTIPSGNLYPLVAGAPQAKTRPEVYAMGFRNPFRIQVDENDVAYTTDYSPDAQTPQRGRGPAGIGRVEIVRKPSNYGWPMCYTTKVGYYQWNFSEFAEGTTTAGRPLTDTPQAIECGGTSVTNDSLWTRDGGPANEPGLRDTPPMTDPEIWYSYRDNMAGAPLGTPCPGNYAPTPGPIAPGSTTECPRLFPELFYNTAGVGPHGATKYQYDPANPSTTKLPAYYDDTVLFAEYTQDTMREVKLDSQNRILKINDFLSCGPKAAPQPFPFECDGPMDLQFGADGSFYLLQYSGRNAPEAAMFRFDYVKGQRAPRSVIAADRTNGPLPLTVSFNGAGSLDEDPGDSIRYEWDFGDGSPASTEVNPQHVYTKAGRYTAILKVTDSSGKSSSSSTVITAGNTAPTITVSAPRDGGLFSFGDKLQYRVTVTDPDDPSVSCENVTVTFALGHDTHSHDEESKTGCTGFLQTDADDVSHGGNVYGVIRADYTDKGGSGGQAPPLAVNASVEVRQKRQEVEHVVTQFGTSTTANTDGGAGVHRNSVTANDWLKLNGGFDLHQIQTVAFRVADGGTGRAVGSPLAVVELRQDHPSTGSVVATYNLVSTGGSDVWSTQTFALPPAVAASGKHDLFLVIRSVTGGATGDNLFNFNWVEFGGNGVTVRETSSPGTVGGTVPATLSLSLGTPATFGAFTPGVTKEYEASGTATITSTAGDASLTVSDPGHLSNGAFSLAEPLRVAFSKSAWTGPTSNENVGITFNQLIKRTDPLRTGTYSKTLTFTLSTTTP